MKIVWRWIGSERMSLLRFDVEMWHACLHTCLGTRTGTETGKIHKNRMGHVNLWSSYVNMLKVLFFFCMFLYMCARIPSICVCYVMVWYVELFLRFLRIKAVSIFLFFWCVIMMFSFVLVF